MLHSRNLLIVTLMVSFTLAACASQGPRKSEAGVYEIGKLRITLDSGWYEQRGAALPDTRARSKTWSREGLEHDRLLATGGVDGGESMFKGGDNTAMPAFRPNMSTAEIADFVANSLQRVLWNGAASIRASNVRERGFTGVPGFEFELSADVPGSASHRGIAGGFIVEERLYLTVYLAESPGYFERYSQSAQAIIDSSVPTMKTIRW